MRGGLIVFSFHPQPSTLILRSGISSDFDVTASANDFNILKFQSIRHSVDTGAAHRTGRFTSADDFGSNKKGDLVYQLRINKVTCDSGAAFDQDALYRTTAKRFQHRQNIAAARSNEFHSLRFKSLNTVCVGSSTCKDYDGSLHC